jgi:ABC-type sulfate transport system permease component
MILPLYAFLVKMNQSLPEAASDLGATPWEIFLVLHQFHCDFSLAAGQSSDSIFPA